MADGKGVRTMSLQKNGWVFLPCSSFSSTIAVSLKIAKVIGASAAVFFAAALPGLACAHLEFDRHSDNGAYVRYVNGCSYPVIFVYTSGGDGTGTWTREHNTWIAARTTKSGFIYAPLPPSYRTRPAQ